MSKNYIWQSLLYLIVSTPLEKIGAITYGQLFWPNWAARQCSAALMRASHLIRRSKAKKLGILKHLMSVYIYIYRHP